MYTTNTHLDEIESVLYEYNSMRTSLPAQSKPSSVEAFIAPPRKPVRLIPLLWRRYGCQVEEAILAVLFILVTGFIVYAGVMACLADNAADILRWR